MFCTQCGAQLKEGLKFCINCGARLEEAHTQVQESQPPALAEDLPSAKLASEPALPEGIHSILSSGVYPHRAVSALSSCGAE